MKVIETVAEMRELAHAWKNEGLSIGLVPTMGYLHEGHISLVDQSVKDNDKTIISIFVNPIQFGPHEDLDTYPRDLDHDLALCEKAHVDIVFHPTVKEMYPENFFTSVDIHTISDTLCGANRPGHFKGVCTVVTKLFNITKADSSYFGQKDAQQVAVINKMVDDLNMNIEVHAMPIVREADGLAMSSRNSYLSKEERKLAPKIYEALQQGKEAFFEGTKNKRALQNLMSDILLSHKGIRIEYIEIVDLETLADISVIEKPALCAVALHIGKTRLIDNIIFDPQNKERQS